MVTACNQGGRMFCLHCRYVTSPLLWEYSLVHSAEAIIIIIIIMQRNVTLTTQWPRNCVITSHHNKSHLCGAILYNQQWTKKEQTLNVISAVALSPQLSGMQIASIWQHYISIVNCVPRTYPVNGQVSRHVCAKSSCKLSVTCTDFKTNWIRTTEFGKNPQHQISRKSSR
jgi:hypothetical protein